MTKPDPLSEAQHQLRWAERHLAVAIAHAPEDENDEGVRSARAERDAARARVQALLDGVAE